MRHPTLIATTGLMLLMAAANWVPAAAKTTAPAATMRLVNGAPSVDVLLDQFLQALAAKDEAALHRLRVTEREYRQIIIPGTVKVGEPPRKVDATPSEFFWRMLDQKSQDVGLAIMQKFGGHVYKRKELKYSRGIRKFAWYTALGEVRLQIEDENGKQEQLATGSIAEVNGTYKFIGFNYNN